MNYPFKNTVKKTETNHTLLTFHPKQIHTWRSVRIEGWAKRTRCSRISHYFKSHVTLCGRYQLPRGHKLRNPTSNRCADCEAELKKAKRLGVMV